MVLQYRTYFGFRQKPQKIRTDLIHCATVESAITQIQIKPPGPQIQIVFSREAHQIQK